MSIKFLSAEFGFTLPLKKTQNEGKLCKVTRELSKLTLFRRGERRVHGERQETKKNKREKETFESKRWRKIEGQDHEGRQDRESQRKVIVRESLREDLRKPPRGTLVMKTKSKDFGGPLGGRFSSRRLSVLLPLTQVKVEEMGFQAKLKISERKGLFSAFLDLGCCGPGKLPEK